MEIWKPVTDFEGLYEVSNLGQVRSIGRDIDNNRGGIRWMPELVLSVQINTKRGNYHTVMLSKDGKSKKAYIHLTVLQAFIGPRPFPEMEGCHGDGDTANNQLINLRWDTKVNNAADRVSHGTQVQGEASNKAVINIESVREIKRRAEKGDTFTDIAETFGISRQQISRIVKGKQWKHVK